MGVPDERLSIYTGRCPQCDSSAIKALRCERCPVLEVEYQRSVSAAGRLLERMLDLRFELEAGVPTPDITCEEAMALRVMKDETGKWEREQMDKQRQEQREMAAEQRAQQLVQQGHRPPSMRRR